MGTQPIGAREAAPASCPAAGQRHEAHPGCPGQLDDDPPTPPPAVSLFRRLDIGPGDVLVYETPGHVTQTMADAVKALLATYFPGVPTLVVSGGRLYVAAAPPAREQIDASTLGQAPGSVTVEGRRIGTCPVCGSTVPLDEAGRVGPHITLMGAGPCRGTGRFTSDVAFP